MNRRTLTMYAEYMGGEPLMNFRLIVSPFLSVSISFFILGLISFFSVLTPSDSIFKIYNAVFLKKKYLNLKFLHAKIPISLSNFPFLKTSSSLFSSRVFINEGRHTNLVHRYEPDILTFFLICESLAYSVENLCLHTFQYK